MKVYINNYRNHWLSPYIILEKVFFWREIDYDEPKIEKWAERLKPFSNVLQKVLNVIHPKIDYIKIDRWDTWDMEQTLGLIVLPMLKQLQATKQGAPLVDDEDVPEELKSTSVPQKENEYTDDNHFKRWDWVLNEMIFSFGNEPAKWKKAYCSGNYSKRSEACAWDENGKPTIYEIVENADHTYKCDYEGMDVVEKRIKNGFRLFGKYYQNLWD